MKRLLVLALVALMLLQCACAAVPSGVLSNDDAEKLNADEVKTLFTTEYAYIRAGGSWSSKNWHTILAERGRDPMLIIKNGATESDVTRHALLKFDISGVSADDVGSAKFMINFTGIQPGTDVPFDIYLVGSNWSEDKVTYKTKPQKLSADPVDSGVILKNEGADVTAALRSMISKGEKELSLMVVQTVNTENETKIQFSLLGDGEMPRIVIDKNGSSDPGNIEIAEEIDKTVKNFYATDYAYVRGGKWSTKTWQTINRESGGENIIYIKNGLWTNDIARLAFFKYDISGLKLDDVGFAEVALKFKEIQDGQIVHFDVYLVEDGWNSNTLTWNTRPQKLNETPIVAGAVFGRLAKVDVTEFVEDLIFDGKTTFSIMLVQVDETDTVTKIDPSDFSNMPTFKVYAEKPDTSSSYVKDLTGNEALNKAIWDRAKQMYDEWYARYLVVKEKPLGKVSEINSDPAHFSINVKSPGSNPSGTFVNRPTRTVDTITDLSKYVDITKEIEFDTYGGIKDDTIRQDITGYFYTKKIGDRWWLIDPLGYPCILRCVSGVTMSYQNSPTQKAASLALYGDAQKWALATSRHLKDDLGFNSHSTSDQEMYNVVDGLASFKRFSLMSGYASSKGVNSSVGGRTRLSENNTMPVFDPDFETYTDSRVKSNVSPDDQSIVAYISDNELPVELTLLKDYLTVDYTKEVNYYSYACAWYWLTQMTGKDIITDDDITDELSELFRGFIWDRYLYVVTTAIDKYDPNHLYAGTKYLNYVKDAEWILRFGSQYIDILTINWYGAWEPQLEFVYDFMRYADAPFMVTEFYAKSSETFDNLTNRDGAGFYVNTQADRGLFYQNYTLRLLESKNCVGWQWFQFTDNDPAGNPTDVSSRDANKGIVNNRYEEYTELADDMAVINKNVYKLIEYFDAKYSK